LQIRIDMKGVVIEAVVPGSWAAVHTKLRKGDRLVRVNGKEMAGTTPGQLLEALRAAGPAAHELELAPSEDETAGQNVRLPNPLPTVYGVDLLNEKDGVGYLRLAAFKDQTPRELDDAMLELKARGARVLIIDLRGNPGGLFTAAVATARQFLPAGLIVTTQGQAPDFANRVFTSDAGMSAYDLPVVLLIDTKTMSSAEIFAAGLKENRRATLVGLATFGKGLVQAPVRLQSFDTPEDGPHPSANKAGVLILSVAAVFGPNGAALNGVGVTPHVTEPNAERQLPVAIQKAIELLQGPPMPMIMR
jgi:carboxyl-terminal processing protease